MKASLKVVCCLHVLTWLCLSNETAWSQVQRNTAAPWSLNRPKEFNEFVSKATAESYYSGGDLTRLDYNSGYQWMVWCAHEATPIMPGPSNTGQSLGKLTFRQRLIVTDVKNDGVQISRDQDNEQPFGWVNASNLILSPWALETRGGVGRKALVVPNLESQSSPEAQRTRTQLYNHSNVSGRDELNGQRANLFNVLYILKETEKAMLLSTGPLIGEGNVNSMVIGWMPKRYLTEWNRRVAYAPAYGGRGAPVGETIPFFQSSADLEKFISSNSYGHAAHSEYVLQAEQVPMVPAYPDIGDDSERSLNNERRKLLTIIGTSTRPGDVKKRTELAQRVEELAARISKINLLFVVDATASMGPYFPSIAQSIQDINTWTTTWSGDVDIKVGFGVYRDYADGEECVEQFKVQKFDETMGKQISQVVCQSKDRDKPEAVYKGIVDNLSRWNPNPNETNIVVLIGDEGNHENDTRYNFRQVEEALNKIKASLFVFQTTAFMSESSMRFQTDALNLLSSIQRSNSSMSVQSQLERTKPGIVILSFDNDDDLAKRQGALITQSDSPGKKTSPQTMAEIIKRDIEDWIKKVERQIEFLRAQLSGVGAELNTEQRERIVQQLISEGWTRKEAEAFLTRGGDVTVARHTSIASRQAIGQPVLIPYIFISLLEYQEISESFAKLKAGGTSVERTERLYNLCTSVIRTQVGSNQEVEKYLSKTLREIWIEFFQVDFNINALRNVQVRNIKGLSGQEFEDAYAAMAKAAEAWLQLDISKREWRVTRNREARFYWVDATFFPGFAPN
jgi:hypothetical protein